VVYAKEQFKEFLCEAKSGDPMLAFVNIFDQI